MRDLSEPNYKQKNIAEISHKMIPKHHLVATAIIGGAMAAGGLYATIKGSQEMKKAKKYLRENKELWAALQTPDIENLKVKLEQAVSQGKLDPKIGQAILQDPSAMKDVGADPKLVQAQEQSLGALQRIAQSGGQDATTRARMAQTMGQVGQQERASREALQAQMQRRGIGGGGTDIASQMLAQQQSAGQAAQMGFQTAADAEQRALQAIAQSGQMAGQMRSQQVGEDAARAQAMDRINQFNTQHRQQLQASNYAALNAAEAANLQAAQQLENQNVGRRESRNLQHTQAYQTDFANRAKKTQGIAGANTGLAGAQQQQGQMWGQFGGSLLGSGGSMLAQGLKPEKPEGADGLVVQSQNQGGMVPGNSYAGDRVDAQVNSGEMILNVEQQQNLLDLIAGKTDQIDPNIPIVQENPQMQEQEMDPLAVAAQQQMPQQQMPQQPPMQNPVDMIAGMQQEEPIQAADGAIAPIQPNPGLPQFAQPPTPIEAMTTNIMTTPPAPPTPPITPITPQTQNPVDMIAGPMPQSNLPVEEVSMGPQMAPVTDAPPTEAGSAIPEEDLVEKVAKEEASEPTDLSAIGKGVAGLGDAVSAAFGGKGQSFARIQASEERQKVRDEKKADQTAEAKQRSEAAQLKRKQDMEDYKAKEKYKVELKAKRDALEQDKKLTGTFQERVTKMSSEGQKSVGLLTSALNSMAKADKILNTTGYTIKDEVMQTALAKHFNLIVNDVLRNESGAAIGEEEYKKIRAMLPDLTDETISPGIRMEKMKIIRDKIMLALAARGLADKKELGNYLNTHVGFYDSLDPNSKLMEGFGPDKEAKAQGGGLQEMSDPDLDAEIAAEEAKLAQ